MKSSKWIRKHLLAVQHPAVNPDGSGL
jgi:hypothetical protein